MAKPKERFVLIKGIICRWEDKEPFVPSGKSVLGAIEYDRDADKVKCHECGSWMNSVSNHVKPKHDISVREYKYRHGLSMRSHLAIPTFVTAARFRGHRLSKADSERGRESVNKKTERTTRKTAHGFMEYRNMHAKCMAQLAARVQQLSKDLGYTPTGDEMHAAGITSHNISTSELHKLARLQPRQPGGNGHVRHGDTSKRYAREVLIELLRDFYVLNGRLPRRLDWTSGLLPTSSTYVKRFGGLRQAYAAAGFGKILLETEKKQAA